MGLPEKERAGNLARELEAVRDAVGNSMDLALEASETFSVRSAIELAEMVQDLDGWLTAGGFLPRAWRSAKPF